MRVTAPASLRHAARKLVIVVEHVVGRWKDRAKALAREVRDDRAGSGAAALAFYLVLAIFPAAIFGLSLLPYLPIPRLEQAVLDLIHEAMPPAAADLFTGTVNGVLSRRRGGLLSFGLLLSLWSASSGLYAIMQQLNVVYGVRERRSFLRARAVALLLTLAFFLLVVGGLGLVVFGGVLESWLGGTFGFSDALLAGFAAARWIVIVLAIQLALSLVYWAGPSHDARYGFLRAGPAFATAGLVVASFAFKLYVSRFASYDAVYGSLGAVIVLLLWLYVTGWVILLGGEIDGMTTGERAPRRQ